MTGCLLHDCSTRRTHRQHQHQRVAPRRVVAHSYLRRRLLASWRGASRLNSDDGHAGIASVRARGHVAAYDRDSLLDARQMTIAIGLAGCALLVVGASHWIGLVLANPIDRIAATCAHLDAALRRSCAAGIHARCTHA